jgi:RNA 3'-terminal phosphate cyclase
MALLVVGAVALALLSLNMASPATFGVHLIGMAVFLVALARIAQASVQGRK